ncbi:MAG TPA: geranylgeranylglyceryl/heptaprenylglyceryl phosphate synthase, partial [Bacteroidia bacterium]|nr:geranylgeranylglyceryl/heptaprenylglyceryl phosphate synthase [Bacteroidia bacterium]
MRTSVYNSICEGKQKGSKKLAVLIDPDKFKSVDIVNHAEKAGADYLFIGGSLLSKGDLHACVSAVKKATSLPIVLFPGSVDQIDPTA